MNFIGLLPLKPRCVFAVLAGCIALVPAVPAQDKPAPSAAAPSSSANPANSASPASFSYEVVSIKPYKDTGAGFSMWWNSTKDGFSAKGVDLATLIRDAYDIVMEDQLTGLPPWAKSDRYSLDAKMDEETAAAFDKLPRDQKDRIEDAMLQATLADRFQLKLHKETRELPIYNLVVAKGGLKIQPTPEGKNMGYSVGMGKLNGNGIELDNLAYSLSGQVGRLIVNNTGLDGKYTIDLKWQPDSMGAGTAESNAEPLPDLFTALEEQLGLKLEPAKAPVDVYIVDHVEKPSEN